MEGSVKSYRSENKKFHIGNRQLLSSFLSANIDMNAFGSFRIPKSFHNEFGKQLSSSLIIRCKKYVWKGKFDAETKAIYGLMNFMRYYGVKIYSLVQFDYYGKDLFLVKIFKDTATEINYPIEDPVEFFKNECNHNWRKEQYICDSLSLEYQKSSALWLFNAWDNIVQYFDINISSSDIDERLKTLRLDVNLENLYKDWNDDTKIFLRFIDKSWRISIKWMDGTCIFGKGWHEFVLETQLEKGDTLVLFKIPSTKHNIVNVCIFKGQDKVVDKNPESEEWRRGFFKVLSDRCLNEGILAVPKWIKDNYGEKLNRVNEIEVAGERWSIVYTYIDGYVRNLFKMIDHFKLTANETIMFQINNSNVMYARIFQNDGKEIDYARPCIRLANNGVSNSLWDINWFSDSDTDEEDTGEAQDDERIGNSEIYPRQTMSSAKDDEMRVDEEFYPQFIIALKPVHHVEGKLELTSTSILEYVDQIPIHIRLQFPTGLEIHVNFNKKDHSLYNMERFLKEIIKVYGSIIIFRYRGEGVFSVHLLNDDSSEVEYDTMRSIPRAPVYQQDQENGVGMKFLISINGRALDFGEVAIPDSFYERFGKVIPAAITFELRNGELYNGYYVANEKKIFGLLEIIGLKNLQKRDYLLFTYSGVGRLAIDIFDKSKVEKSYDVTVTAIGREMQMEPHTVNNVEDGTMIEAEVSENVEAEEMDDEDMEVNEMEFTAKLTLSNVNHSCHGVHIPRYIKPNNRAWQIGDRVTFRTPIKTWLITIVFNNGIPRFSAGWNSFSRDNKLKENQILVFTMVEDDNGIVFDIQIP